MNSHRKAIYFEMSRDKSAKVGWTWKVGQVITCNSKYLGDLTEKKNIQ